jgi:hypothetical protein
MLSDHESDYSHSQSSRRDGLPDKLEIIELSVEIERCTTRLGTIVGKLIATNGSGGWDVVLLKRECVGLSSAAVRLASAVGGAQTFHEDFGPPDMDHIWARWGWRSVHRLCRQRLNTDPVSTV